MVGEKAYLRVKSLNLKRMGSRYIEILDSTEREFQAAMDTQLPSGPHSPTRYEIEQDDPTGETWNLTRLNKSGIVRIRGLPFRVTTMELAIFFSGCCNSTKTLFI